MTFEKFKEEFDAAFEQVTPQELVAELEEMGYQFIPQKVASPFLQEGMERKTFPIEKRVKIRKLIESYSKHFPCETIDNSFLLAA